MNVEASGYRPAADAAVRVPHHVVYRNFAEETVVLNLETGTYHSLSPAAGRMLELLDKTGSARQAAAKLADETGESASDLELKCLALCSELVGLRLIAVGSRTA